ncbi:MAG TPA: protein kinase [Kofleriaceae bacterium]|nr:protein kinase [Kofleriaceae bacterium]
MGGEPEGGGRTLTLGDRIGAEETVAVAAPGTDATVAAGSQVAERAGGAAAFAAAGERYVELDEIGRGGLGRVARARDRVLDRTVALKWLLRADAATQRRFVGEAMVTARLQHPSIVPVYDAGSGRGEPFYAMKLVAGKSLAELLAEATTADARLALLPSVLAVAQAIAYAHSEKVIHRDLKPHNVIVGAFGETVVIDWGLAKRLGAAEEAASAGASVSGDQTVAGDVLGTPAYMAPEQARGEELDERADVFALGALLYHVLAGRAPYVAGDVEAILALARAGDAPPLPEAAPAELRAITHKAMAKGAADRYATAAQLAEDLVRFQTGQLVGSHRYTTWQLVARWMGRHRAAVAVAGVAAAVLVVLGAVGVAGIVREQARTEAQRAAAEASRRQAEDLMGFMLGDLKEKLDPLGQLPLLDAVAQKAIAYYDQRVGPRSDEERRRHAVALGEIGDVLVARGELDAAAVQYRASLELLQAMQGADARDVALAWNRIGDARFDKGALDAARQAYDEATTVLAAADPHDAGVLLARAANEDALGQVSVGLGDHAAAAVHHRAAIAVEERLSAAQPGNDALRRGLARSYRLLGDVLETQGDLAGGLVEHRKALAIAEAMAAAHPDDATAARALANSHQVVARVLQAQGDRAAVDSFRTSLAIAQRLAAQDPTNASRKLDVLKSRLFLGDALKGSDLDAALVELRAARAIGEGLVALDPRNATWRDQLGNSMDSTGNALVDKGDLAGAQAEYEAGLAVGMELAALDPRNAEWQRKVAVGQGKIGYILQARGDLPGALDRYRKSLAIRRTLAAGDPTNAERKEDIAYMQASIGDILRAQKDRDGELAARRETLALYQELAARDPSVIKFRRHMAITHQNLSTVLGLMDDLSGAIRESLAALAIEEKLVAENPDSTKLRYGLLVDHWNLGELHDKAGDGEKARAAYEASLAVGLELVKQEPASKDWASEVAEIRARLKTCCRAR